MPPKWHPLMKVKAAYVCLLSNLQSFPIACIETDLCSILQSVPKPNNTTSVSTSNSQHHSGVVGLAEKTFMNPSVHAHTAVMKTNFMILKLSIFCPKFMKVWSAKKNLIQCIPHTATHGFNNILKGNKRMRKTLKAKCL